MVDRHNVVIAISLCEQIDKVSVDFNEMQLAAALGKRCSQGASTWTNLDYGRAIFNLNALYNPKDNGVVSQKGRAATLARP